MSSELEEARQKGIEDAEAGIPPGDNPYPVDDERHWFWYSGWVVGKVAVKTRVPSDILSGQRKEKPNEEDNAVSGPAEGR